MSKDSEINHFFICFTGLDGGGKTTQAMKLVESLKTKGIKCEYVYARLNPFILKPFMLMGEKIFLNKKNIYDDYINYSNTKKNAISKHSFLSQIYEKILLFDYFIQMCIKIKIPLLFGKSIVCDRYIFDTVVTDIYVDMQYSNEKLINLLNILFHLFPKPDMTFLIDIPEEIAFNRKDDTPSIEYLKERRDMYLHVGEIYNMIVLDGSLDRNKLQILIREKSLQMLGYNE